MDPLQDGLSLVTQAVQLDSQGNIEAATQYYQRGIVSLEQALIIERDSDRRNLIAQKLGEYQARNEVLKEQLSKRDLVNRIANTSGFPTLPSQYEYGTNALPQQQNQFNQNQNQFNPQASYPPPAKLGSDNFNLSNSMSNLKDPRFMTKMEAYSAAAEVCQKATLEDEVGRYETARRYYLLALDYFNRALTEETDPVMRQKLTEKTLLYSNRADQLGAALGMSGSKVLVCFQCTNPIDNVSPYKVVDNKSYHSKCFEAMKGLEREASKSFFMSSDQAFMRVKIPKKTMAPGETIEMVVHVQNRSSKVIKKVVAYLLKFETQVNVVTGGRYGVERKAKTKENKFGRKEYLGINNQFPLEHGEVTLGKAEFVVPTKTPLSELYGPYCREFELVVKCVFPKPTPPLKVTFPVSISHNK